MTGILTFDDNTLDENVGLLTTSRGQPLRGRIVELTAVLGGIQYFDDRQSPVALYDFSQPFASMLDDLSGNNLDLTQSSGNLVQADMFPGKAGLYIRTGSRVQTAVVQPLLQIAGDLTLAIIMSQDQDSVNAPLIGCGGATEVEADNFQYLWGNVNNAPPRRCEYVCEQGAGVNVTFNQGTGAGRALPQRFQTSVQHMTRIGNVIQFYSNGRAMGAPSAVLAAPTGGSNALFLVGAAGPSSTAPVDLMIGSIAVYSRGFTAAEVAADYNYTLGPFYGAITPATP